MNENHDEKGRFSTGSSSGSASPKELRGLARERLNKARSVRRDGSASGMAVRNHVDMAKQFKAEAARIQVGQSLADRIVSNTAKITAVKAIVEKSGLTSGKTKELRAILKMNSAGSMPKGAYRGYDSDRPSNGRPRGQ